MNNPNIDGLFLCPTIREIKARKKPKKGRLKNFWSISSVFFWRLIGETTPKDIPRKMIDTIILTIPKQAYKITDHSRFNPSTEKLDDINVGFAKFINNPTLEDKRRGYHPRLTIIKRGFEEELKVEFSVPKLIYGNSLDELSETSFDEVVNTLHQRIKGMGVFIHSADSIKYADVSSFHPAKNIELSGGYTALYVLREIKKIDLHAKYDISEVKYRNGGHSLQCYSTSNSVVFYDKIIEATVPENRRVDTEAAYQKRLFNVSPEVLRMEVRLTNKNKMNAVMEKLELPRNPLFKDIFSTRVCQKILLDYWNTLVVDKNEFLFSPINQPQRLYALIKQNSPGISNKDAIYLVGLDLLTKDNGVRELKTLVEKHNSKRAWLRTKKDFQRLNNLKPDDQGIGFIKVIEQALIKFEPYRSPEDKV